LPVGNRLPQAIAPTHCSRAVDVVELASRFRERSMLKTLEEKSTSDRNFVFVRLAWSRLSAHHTVSNKSSGSFRERSAFETLEEKSTCDSSSSWSVRLDSGQEHFE
jgi:hypothetical protein